MTVTASCQRPRKALEEGLEVAEGLDRNVSDATGVNVTRCAQIDLLDRRVLFQNGRRPLAG